MKKDLGCGLMQEKDDIQQTTQRRRNGKSCGLMQEKDDIQQIDFDTFQDMELWFDVGKG